MLINFNYINKNSKIISNFLNDIEIQKEGNEIHLTHKTSGVYIKILNNDNFELYFHKYLLYLNEKINNKFNKIFTTQA